MKKIVIAIIVILSLLLVIQLAYYNLSENNDVTNANNSTISISENSNNNDNSSNINNTSGEVIEKQEDVIAPSGITSLAEEYNGNLKLITVEKELYNFVYNNVETIRKQTSWKSINYILQYYDLHKSEINQMGIYSKEDYRAIANQVNSISKSENYERSSINSSSFEQTQDGYLKFTVSLIYSNGGEIILNMYLANNVETVPNVKYTSGV